MEVKIMIRLEHLAVAETMAVVASEMPGVSSRAPAIVIFWQPRSASPTLPTLILQNHLKERLIQQSTYSEEFRVPKVNVGVS